MLEYISFCLSITLFSIYNLASIWYIAQVRNTDFYCMWQSVNAPIYLKNTPENFGITCSIEKKYVY